MYIGIPSSQAVSSSTDGLTWAELVANLPHDPFTVFTVLLMVAMLIGLFRATRPVKPSLPPELRR